MVRANGSGLGYVCRGWGGSKAPEETAPADRTWKWIWAQSKLYTEEETPFKARRERQRKDPLKILKKGAAEEKLTMKGPQKRNRQRKARRQRKAPR